MRTSGCSSVGSTLTQCKLLGVRIVLRCLLDTACAWKFYSGCRDPDHPDLHEPQLGAALQPRGVGLALSASAPPLQQVGRSLGFLLFLPQRGLRCRHVRKGDQEVPDLP